MNFVNHPPSLHFFDFSFNKFLFMLFSACFKNCYVCCPRTCGWCIILACAPTNGIQQLVHSAPSVFPTKKSHEWGHNFAPKRSSKGLSSENFLATGGFFEHNTYSARLFEERKKMNNSDFWPFRLVNLEQVLDTITVTVTGAAYTSSSKCL